MAAGFLVDGIDGPHRGQPVYTAGRPLAVAKAALVLVHGRGASAADIMGLADELGHPELAYLAPAAAGNTWYPQRFTAPLASNEPWLSSALALLGRVLTQVESSGIPVERTAMLGFSQGACLVLEYTARHPRRYGAVVGFSGGLIGPDEPRLFLPAPGFPGLDGTPVFIGCGDADTHIPQHRVVHAARELERLGGAVEMRLYPGMGHSINQDELEFVRSLLGRLAGMGPADRPGRQA